MATVCNTHGRRPAAATANFDGGGDDTDVDARRGASLSNKQCLLRRRERKERRCPREARAPVISKRDRKDRVVARVRCRRRAGALRRLHDFRSARECHVQEGAAHLCYRVFQNWFLWFHK